MADVTWSASGAEPVEEGYDITMTEKKAVCHRSRTESINRRCLASVWFSNFLRPSQHPNLDRHCTPTQRQRGHRNGVDLLQCVGQGAELLPVHWNPSLTYVPFRQDCVLIAPIQHPSCRTQLAKAILNLHCAANVSQNGIYSSNLPSIFEAGIVAACSRSFPTFGVRGSSISSWRRPIFQTNTNSIFLSTVESLTCTIRCEDHANRQCLLQQLQLTSDREANMLVNNHVSWAPPRTSLAFENGWTIRDIPW